MFKLVISDDEGKTTVVPFIREDITIGRKEGNTIRLTDRNVSRSHARIYRDGEDKFVIEDLGSFCGTKIEGRTLRSESSGVSPGDQINIGDYSLSVRTDVSSTVPLGRQMEPGDSVGIGKVTPHARLVMLKGPEPGREYDLTAELYVIGRSEESNLRVEDQSISRAHARIDGDDGKWTISDLDSINGIFVNGLRKDDYLLKPGDYIELGTVVLRYVAPGEPYEFRPVTDDLEEPVNGQVRLSRLAYFFIVLGLLAVGAIVGITIVLTSSDINERSTVGSNEAKTKQEQAADLIELGKDKMQAEQWADAARLFAKAFQLDHTRSAAKEMKNLSLQEVDAQQAYQKGQTARARGNWQGAVHYFTSISRSSFYHRTQEIQKMSSKLCDELLEKAKFVAGNDDLAGALEILERIDDIPETNDVCSKQKNLLATEFRSKLKSSGGSKQSGSKRNIEDNPYGS